MTLHYIYGFYNNNEKPRELDAGLLTVKKVKSMENLRNLMQVKLFTQTLCCRLLGLEQTDTLTKFSCILFRKSTFYVETVIFTILLNFYKISLGKTSVD